MPTATYRKFLILLLFLSPLFSCAQATLVNINTAGSSELQTLKGIGPTYAQRIIDYRNVHGPFQKIEDVKNVSGIGDTTFANMKDYITVGEVSSTNPTPPTPSAESASTSSAATNVSTVTISTHYSAVPISNLDTNSDFKISAGRDRIGSVGTPLEFKAETNLERSRKNILSWNFGDGSQAAGEIVTHTYLYPGEYVVILSMTSLSNEAVSRANVKIVNPELSITYAGEDRVEISNNSQNEVSLFGRALVNGEKVFVFPRDTIVKAGQKISFSSAVTGLYEAGNSHASLLVVGTEVRPQEVLSSLKAQRELEIKTLSERLGSLQNELIRLKAVGYSSNVAPEPLVTDTINDTLDVLDSQEALAVEAIDLPASKWSGWVGFLKSFFLRKE